MVIPIEEPIEKALGREAQSPAAILPISKEVVAVVVRTKEGSMRAPGDRTKRPLPKKATSRQRGSFQSFNHWLG